ncbi:Retinoblastoma-binding protein 5-like protein, partial [Fragariocoptes setiger]
MTLSLALVDNTNLENIPEEFDGTLEPSGLALCCAFNRHGSLLAVGCNDGSVVIYDFLTRTPAKTIYAHFQQICSVSWSRNGRRLALASLDNSVTVWDVMSAKCLLKWQFPSPLIKVQFNPRNDQVILVCPYKHPTVLLHVKSYEKNKSNHYVVPTDPDEPDPNIVASFDRRGYYIYTGNSKGRVAVIRCPTNKEFNGIGCGTINNNDDCHGATNSHMQVVATFRIQSSSTIPASVREIEFASRNKSFFLVNSSDRAIRMYNCEEVISQGINGDCQEVRRFQELVNKTMWRRCCFSESIHVCGGSSRSHALYIWEADSGIIKKILDGQKGELLLDVQWHPLRPVLVSVASGIVSLWAKAQVENWSAFAPDFKELEENIEYEERESEFDLDDEDNRKMLKDSANPDETEDVDVLAMEADRDLMSSDEESEDPNALVFLPTVLEDVISESVAQPLNEVPADSTQIDLENAPIDEVHPLISGSSAKKYYNSNQPVKRPSASKNGHPGKKKSNNNKRNSNYSF